MIAASAAGQRSMASAVARPREDGGHMAAQQPLAFGELLKRHRLAAGLTQAQLAVRAGLSERAISDLERGARRVPQRATLQLLAEALGLAGAEQAALQAAVVRTRPRTTAEGLPPGSVALASRGPVPHCRLLPHATAVLPPLIGRTHELALLEGHLAGERPALLLAGEPGIGKSRPLAQAATRAPGWTVLAG